MIAAILYNLIAYKWSLIFFIIFKILKIVDKEDEEITI